MKRKLPADSFYVPMKGMRPSLGSREATEAYYWVVSLLCPKLPGDPIDYGFGHGKARRELQSLPNIGTFYPRGYDAALHSGSPEKQAALNILFNEVRKLVDASHKEGVEEGRNLLLGLARGDLTSDQAHGLAPIAEKET